MFTVNATRQYGSWIFPRHAALLPTGIEPFELWVQMAMGLALHLSSPIPTKFSVYSLLRRSACLFRDYVSRIYTD